MAGSTMPPQQGIDISRRLCWHTHVAAPGHCSVHRAGRAQEEFSQFYSLPNPQPSQMMSSGLFC
eukprot:711312-Karenia_brevis.AAC.1